MRHELVTRQAYLLISNFLPMTSLIDSMPPVREPRRMAFSGGVTLSDGNLERMEDLVLMSWQMISDFSRLRQSPT